MKRFLTALQLGSTFIVMALSSVSHAAETHVDAGTFQESAMVGAYYMRDTLVPRTDDLALLQRKPALYVSSFNDGMATVAYSVDEGRIIYRVVQGEIGDEARIQIDRALIKLQRKLV